MSYQNAIGCAIEESLINDNIIYVVNSEDDKNFQVTLEYSEKVVHRFFGGTEIMM
jgi:hypothetical protein